MQSISLHIPETDKEPLDLASQIARLEALLAERRRELAALQEEMHAFKARYTQVVGSRLAELTEIEREIKQAKSRLLGLENAEDEEAAGDEEQKVEQEQPGALPVGKAMRKLFWAVAKMFHPDHAADEREARARHTIMAEASRA
jgi:DNA gyrase/topoisomerase IV subunit A